LVYCGNQREKTKQIKKFKVQSSSLH